MNYKIEVSKHDKDNERLHEQVEQMTQLVGDGQISLICLGEFNEEDGGLRCKATTAVCAARRAANLALAACLFENMMQNEQLCNIILSAAYMFSEHADQQEQKASLN